MSDLRDDDSALLELFDEGATVGDGDGEESSDNERFEDQYDEEGYGDEADREALAKLPRNQRLSILAERLEDREDRLRRRQQYLELKAQRKSQQQKKKPAASRQQASKKPVGSAAALADLKKKRGRVESRRRGQAYDSYEEDSAEELSDDDGDDDTPDYEGRAKRARARQERESEALEPSPPATYEEFSRIVLTRETLQKWLGEPWWQEHIRGFYVRMALVGQTNAENKQQYGITRVAGYKEYPGQLYALPGRSERTAVYLQLQDPRGKSMPVQMTVVSNTPPTPSEFQTFLSLFPQGRVPTRRDVAAKQGDLERIANWEYTDEQLSQMIKMAPDRKRQLLLQRQRDTDLAIRHMRSQLQKQVVSGTVDAALEASLKQNEARLAQLDEEIRSLGELKTYEDKLESAKILYNAEQRRQALASTREQITKPDRVQDTAARRDTAPQPLWSVPAEDKPASQQSAAAAAPQRPAPAPRPVEAAVPRVSLSSALQEYGLAEKLQAIHPAAPSFQPRPVRPVVLNPNASLPGFEYTRMPGLNSALTLSEYIAAKDKASSTVH